MCRLVAEKIKKTTSIMRPILSFWIDNLLKNSLRRKAYLEQEDSRRSRKLVAAGSRKEDRTEPPEMEGGLRRKEKGCSPEE